MVKIEVKDTEVKTRSGISQKTNKEYRIRSQQAWAFLPGEPYPVKIDLNLQDNQVPYEPGYYQLGPQSFQVNRYGGLELSRNLDLQRQSATSTSSTSRAA